MKKRILSLLLVLLMVVSLVPTAAMAEETADMTYEVTGGLLYLKQYTKQTSRFEGWVVIDCDAGVTAANIPSNVNGIDVVAIGGFSGCKNLASVTIPDSVTSIGSYAFSGCTSLTDITIPDSVTEIWYNAFYNCSSLANITIPNSVTNIGRNAFESCASLTSIIIPDSVTSIEPCAFRNCTSLASVTIPNSVTSIGSYAFSGCTSLTSVTIPSSATSIDTAFVDCSSLTSINVAEDNASYSSDDGVLFNKEKTKLIAYPGGKIASSYTIPNGVTSIGGCAFYNCTSLTSIEIPNGVTSIGSGAFYHCTSLTDITIPDSVTSIGRSAFFCCTGLASITIPNSVTVIGDWVFRDCTSLASIEVSEDNKRFSSEDGVLFNKNKTRLEIYPQGSERTEYTVPDGVTNIDESAFLPNKSLATLTLPTSIASLYVDVFRDLKALNKIIYKGTSEQLGKINIWQGELGGLNIEWLTIHADIYCTDKIIHQLSDVFVPPTCTTQGYTHHACKNCDYNYDDDIKAAFGHNYVDGKCTRCGLSESGGETHTHDYKAVVTKPTCTSAGYTTYTCTGCGHSYKDNYKDALGHDYKNGECIRCHAKDPNHTHTHDYKAVVTKPTCTSAGYTTYTCTGCGHSYKDNYKDALGHDYKNGECTRCHAKDPNHTHTHDYKSTVTKPTCTEKGYTTHTCSCGDSYKDSYKDALGHLYIFGKCIRCGEKEDSSETHKHDYKSRVVEPTCTEGGYTLWECECGKSYETLHTKALGHEYKDGLCVRCGAKDPNAHTHKYVETVTKPTCTEKGYTTYTCSVCNDSYKGSYTDSLGHSYVGGVCTRCGAKDPNYKPAVSFIDVPSDAFYANAVKWAVENEITTGVGNNRFDPNGQCTRGQVVTFLWRAAGKPTVSANVSFSDVQPGAFYYEAVKWAVANGITTGVGGNRFAPNDSCTRGQVVTFLHRAENSPGVSSVSSFADVPSTAFYYNAVNWAVANGITNGTGNGRFSPNDTCTRAQVVTFLFRAQ